MIPLIPGVGEPIPCKSPRLLTITRAGERQMAILRRLRKGGKVTVTRVENGKKRTDTFRIVSKKTKTRLGLPLNTTLELEEVVPE